MCPADTLEVFTDFYKKEAVVYMNVQQYLCISYKVHSQQLSIW